MRNECNEIKKFFWDYAEGKLPEDLSRLVSEHIKKCKQCAEEYRILSATMQYIELQKSIEPNPFLETRIFAKIAQKPGFFNLSLVLKPVFFAVIIFLSIFLAYQFVNTIVPKQNIYAQTTNIDSVYYIVFNNVGENEFLYNFK